MMLMRKTADKICSREELRQRVERWRSDGEKIVFTNGCFDILHLGHIDYLEQSSKFGTRLVVAVNTDASVKKLKGESRPVNDELARTRIMAALAFVDAVTLFAEETPAELIAYISPDVLVKGSDYSVDQIAGASHVLSNGGEVRTIDLVEGYSTTGLIDRLK